MDPPALEVDPVDRQRPAGRLAAQDRAEVDRPGVQHDVAEDRRADAQPRLGLSPAGRHQGHVQDRRLHADEVARVHLGLDHRRLPRPDHRGTGPPAGAPARRPQTQDRHRLRQVVDQQEVVLDLRTPRHRAEIMPVLREHPVGPRRGPHQTRPPHPARSSPPRSRDTTQPIHRRLLRSRPSSRAAHRRPTRGRRTPSYRQDSPRCSSLLDDADAEPSSSNYNRPSLLPRFTCQARTGVGNRSSEMVCGAV